MHQPTNSLIPQLLQNHIAPASYQISTQAGNDLGFRTFSCSFFRAPRWSRTELHQIWVTFYCHLCLTRMFYISDMLLYFETQTTQGGWGQTFGLFAPSPSPVKIVEGWAECLNK